MKIKLILLSLLLSVSLFYFACKKPFFPSEIGSGQNNYLVIEGVINGNTDSTIIKVSRTQKIDTIPVIIKETNAIVTVESNGNDSFNLIETQPGVYTSPPKMLDNTKKYRLKIKTINNVEYVSDFVNVKDSPPIDSVGFNMKPEGVQIYANSHDENNKTQFYKWDYVETWQFHAFYRSAYKNNEKARQVSEQVYYCFGNDSSNVVNVANTTKLTSDNIYQAPMVFIPSNSEKIETKYSIFLRQYALTSDAYAFWLNLQNNTEKLGSIFDVLPSENLTNYHCVTNPNELVVGYLSVGNTATKRIYITPDNLLKSYTALYPCICDLDTAYTDNHKPKKDSQTPDIFYSLTSEYIPIMGLYLPPPDPFGNPTAYTYTTKLCGDCTVRGTTKQPAFWK